VKNLFTGLARRWDAKVAADLLREEFRNLPMARHCGPLLEDYIAPPSVVPAFADQLAAVIYHVANKVATLHGCNATSRYRTTLESGKADQRRTIDSALPLDFILRLVQRLVQVSRFATG
jgi:hypothetical protein